MCSLQVYDMRFGRSDTIGLNNVITIWSLEFRIILANSCHEISCEMQIIVQAGKRVT